MPIDPSVMESMNQMGQRANERATTRDPRLDWSPQEWDRQFYESIDIPSRLTRDNVGRGQQGPERWEYLFNGEWLNEDQYNDPMWRRNVYDPWVRDQQNNWNRQREEIDTMRRDNNRETRGIARQFAQAPPRGRGYGAGPMGARSSRNYDPAIIERLIGG